MISLSASMPFMPGMWIARRTTSGRCFATTASASKPFVAVSTSYLDVRKYAVSMSRRSGSSSTTRMRVPGLAAAATYADLSDDCERSRRRVEVVLMPESLPRGRRVWFVGEELENGDPRVTRKRHDSPGFV